MSPSARTLVSPGQIEEAITRLGSELTRHYPEGVLLVAVLKGSICFLADLMRAITVPCEVEFMSISAYAEGTGRVRIVKDLDTDIFGRDVVLVEDIVDTGLTLTYLLEELGLRHPRSLEVCALLDKRARRLVAIGPRFLGFPIEDEFVLGYGLDYAERYRNLGEVVAADLGLLAKRPDAYVEEFFGG